MPLTGTLQTAKASGYLQQLCKHFAHKTEVQFTPTEGKIIFGFGTAELLATETALSVTLALNEGTDFTGPKHVIDKHLAIFTHREGGIGLNWPD